MDIDKEGLVYKVEFLDENKICKYKFYTSERAFFNSKKIRDEWITIKDFSVKVYKMTGTWREEI